MAERRADLLPRRAFDEPRLTLAELAKAAGVTRYAAKHYRDGRREMPQAARRKLARFLERHARKLQALAKQLRQT